MTDYWKSVGNYYCDYCKTFVRNDVFSRRQHEASPRHEGALKRQVRDIHRKSEKEARELQQANRELARIGGKVSLPAKAEPIKVLESKAATKPQKIKSSKKEEKRVNTLDDSRVYQAAMASYAPTKEDTREIVEDEEDDAAHRAALAQQAMPGQWTSVAARDKVDEDDEQIVEEIIANNTDEGDFQQMEAVKAEVKPQTPEVPLNNTSEATTASSIHSKRRRDGADEDLISFKVQTKKTADECPTDGDDVPLISFKKKKKKAVA